MITKTIGTLFIVLVCIMVIPIGLGIVGGIFGLVFGVIGAVFGAIFGVIGSIFSAIFGVFGWAFHGPHWHWPFSFFHCNGFTLLAIVVVIALIVRSSNNNRSTR